MALAAINSQIRNMQAYFNVSMNYFKRKNPVMNFIANTVNSLYIMLTSGKRLKALKYQVRFMAYRMHQMDQLIQENNPNNFKGGTNLNSYR